MAKADSGSDQPGARGRSELGARVVSSLVMAVAALVATYLGGWPFALLWLAAAVVIFVEWTAMTRAAPAGALRAAGIVALVGLAAVALMRAPGWLALALAAGGLAATAALARTGRDRLWASAGLAYAAVIATVPILVRDDPRLGLVVVLWMFAVVWISDIVAYFVGRAVGGPKLWPRVSPKKTWSGFLGGLAGAVAAGVAVAAIAAAYGWRPVASLSAVALASAVASTLGQLGDLGESALKRRFEVKDSGQLIPGHGGAMDRLDAFWAVCAFVGAMLLGARLTERW